MSEATAAQGPAKVDPESFELRSRPARAIRFRRGAIIGAAALGSVCLIGVAWYALKPRVAHQLAQDTELSQPMGKATPDAIADAPSSYARAPRLGPPLPGDLGRPILRAQERAQTVALPAQVNNAEAQRQQHLAAVKAALESGLLVQTATGQVASSNRPALPSLQVDTDAQGVPADGKRTRKEQFADGRDGTSDRNAYGLVPPISPSTILAGTVIPASLITGLNSDLPGLVTAQVSQNVYDTVTGRTLLVPQGARLIGKYDSVVAFGQKRALIIWQRLLLLNGSSVRLDNMPATDSSGYAGLADQVDFHTWSLLKGVGLATMLGVGTQMSFSGESDLVEAIRQATQTNTARAADQFTQRNLDVPPSITIRPGAPVRVLVNRDLALEPFEEEVN